MLVGVYNGSSLTCWVKEWVERFWIEQERFEEDTRTDRSLEAVNGQKVCCVEKLVLRDRRFKVKEVSEMSKLCDRSDHRINIVTAF